MAGLNRLIVANRAALLGWISWDLFRFFGDADSVEQEAFNVAYHLKQDFLRVMTWPSSVRRSVWKRILDQYDYEEEQIKSKMGR
jgi:hypothetical protein